ncbi:hypothetical protein L226DRAFT_576504 [Lentinus tigrinus ALCF2SS1-7]|uniref:Homeobox domain-containing protein n=1 Tax=Lentinus tigrinus ALCF2SS1-6 TaxID=1328759 RepID=A0A5C2RNP9_9APHY|nr:hypothetical protein L227DRAFT_403588 [Lentinus tigrinus ALCF2SS1-6]RPD68334.1 hypothetical protein L226DRAFT_576504 [Lentinus tigrinus ALCF2SS1-7]
MSFPPYSSHDDNSGAGHFLGFPASQIPPEFPFGGWPGSQEVQGGYLAPAPTGFPSHQVVQPARHPVLLAEHTVAEVYDRTIAEHQWGTRSLHDVTYGGVSRGIGLDINQGSSSSAVGSTAVTPPNTSTSRTRRPPANHAQTEVLWEFYRTRSKKPTHEERLVLASETGLDPERINRWFRWQRGKDPSYDPQKETERPRKERTRISHDQKVFLTDYMSRNGVPDAPQRAKLAEMLHVDSEYVYNWFETRRSSIRKQAKEAGPCTRPQ